MYVCVGRRGGHILGPGNTIVTEIDTHSPFAQRAHMVNEKMKGTKIERFVRRVIMAMP